VFIIERESFKPKYGSANETTNQKSYPFIKPKKFQKAKNMKQKVSIVCPIKLLALTLNQRNLPLIDSFNLVKTNASFKSAKTKETRLAKIIRMLVEKTELNCSALTQLLSAKGKAVETMTKKKTTARQSAVIQINSLDFVLP
jgi:uncharacterized transporter YbjL